MRETSLLALGTSPVVVPAASVAPQLSDPASYLAPAARPRARRLLGRHHRLSDCHHVFCF